MKLIVIEQGRCHKFQGMSHLPFEKAQGLAAVFTIHVVMPPLDLYHTNMRSTRLLHTLTAGVPDATAVQEGRSMWPMIRTNTRQGTTTKQWLTQSSSVISNWHASLLTEHVNAVIQIKKPHDEGDSGRPNQANTTV